MIESTEKLRKIVSVFWIDADVIDEIVENGQEASISLIDDNEFEQIKFTEANYNEDASDTANGILYQQKLNMVLAGDDKTVQQALIDLEVSKPVFKIEYDNGDMKLIGDKENYCKVITPFSSENFVTKNELNITRSSSCKAFFIAL